MPNTNPTIVSASLSDKELQDSINKMVANFDKGLQTMLEHSNEYVEKIQASLQKIGNTNFGAKGSNDGAVVKQTKAQNDFTDAVKKSTNEIKRQGKEGEMSFDQIAAALDKARRTVSEFNTSRASGILPSSEDYKRYEQALARIVEYNDKLKQSAIEMANANERWFGSFNAKRINESFLPSNKTLSDMKAFYQEQEKNDQKRLANIEKERAAREKMIESARKAEQKYQDATLKSAFRGALALPTNNIDELRYKIERITALAATLKKEGLIDDAQFNRANVAVAKLNEQLNKQLATEKEVKAVQSQQVQPQVKSARDSYIAFMQGYKEQANQLTQLIQNEENRLVQAQQSRVTALGQQIDQNKTKIQELREQMQQLAQEEKNAPSRYGVKDAYRTAIQQTNDEINKLIAKNKELEAEQQKVASTDPLKQQNATLDELRAKREKVLNLMREETRVQQQQAQTTQQQITEEQRRTEEVRKQAAAIRATKEWQEKGIANVNGHVFYDAERVKGTKQHIREIGTLEEQILRSMQQQSVAERANTQEAQQRLDTIKRIAAEARAEMKQYGTSAYYTGYAVQNPYIYAENDARAKGLTIEQQIEQILKEQTKEYERQTEKIQQTTQKRERRAAQDVDKSFKTTLAQTLGINADEINSTDTSIKNLTAYSKQLQQAWEKLSSAGRKSPFGKQLQEELQLTQLQLQRVRNEASRPISLNFVRGMSEKTLDDIAYKIQRLQAYKRGINITDPKQAKELEQVDAIINQLTKDLNKYMSTTRKASEVNNALSRSWNYMKNRLAFYFSVQMSRQFIMELVKVRSEYEMNERALGILIGSAEKGTQVFQELSQMSLVSPYTLIELSAAAKQLTAYDIAARDVVDTTRRLADMASAVGVPIERLTYALGQIKAYGYLNSRDQRMFANAGIPLAGELAKYYTEIEGKLVSTGDVYDRIKKKAVDYNTVMQVMYRMTDEGGKFFDFQAKMADTLKVRIANLTLAWNNMLNDIGKSQQGVLTSGIKGLTVLFRHWEDMKNAVVSIAAAFGTVKLVQFVVLKRLSTQADVAAWHLNGATKGVAKLANNLNLLKSSLLSMAANPWTWVFVGITALMSMVSTIDQARESLKEFNNTLRQGGEENFKNINDFLGQYQDLRKSLGETNAKGEAVSPIKDISNDEAKKAWEAMREQIELSTAASGTYLQSLMSIENVSERLRVGFKLLDDIQQVNAAMKDLESTELEISQSYSSWWNLWTLQDGMIENIKEYSDEVQHVTHGWENFGKQAARSLVPLAGSLYNIYENFNSISNKLSQAKEDIDDFAQSINKFINREGLTGNPTGVIEAYAQAMKKATAEANLSPEQAFIAQKLIEAERSKVVREALKIRIADENAALAQARDENAKADINERLKVLEAQQAMFDKSLDATRPYWDDFNKYIKERHLSEIEQMFRGAETEQERSIILQSAKWDKAVDKWVREYAKSHKMSYDEAFGYLRQWVKTADMWKITIPLIISTDGAKSVLDTLKEADQVINDAYSGIERLKKRRDELKKQGASLLGTTDKDREYAKILKEIADKEKEYADAKAKGGISSKEEKADAKAAKAAAAARKKEDAAAAKAERQAESELAKALGNEIQLINEARSEYKKLEDAGYETFSAQEIIQKSFSQSIKNINAVLAKNNIPLFDLSRFIGASNPRFLLNMLEEQIKALKNNPRVKAAETQKFEIEFNRVDIDAKAFDSKKIAEGLDNSLSRLKDEYELAIALDADPELGNLFADWMGIDTSVLPRTVQEYAERATKYLNQYLNENKAELTIPDILNLTSDDIRAFEEGTKTGLYNKEWVERIKKTYEDAANYRKKDMEDAVKQWNNLIQKYGDLQDQLTKIEKDAMVEQAEVIKHLGDEEQKRRAVDITRMIAITKDPEELARLTSELLTLLQAVSEKSQKGVSVTKAISNEKEQKTSKAYWDDFKNSNLYALTFDDMANNSTRAIQLIITKLNELKDKVKEDPASMKALMDSLQKAEEELNARNPFKAVIDGLKEWYRATKEVKQAELELKVAQQQQTILQNAYNQALKEGDPVKIAAAKEHLATATQRVKNAEEGLVNAENKAQKGLNKFQTNLSNTAQLLQQVSDGITAVEDIMKTLGADEDTIEFIEAINSGFQKMITILTAVAAAITVIIILRTMLNTVAPELLIISLALAAIIGMIQFLDSHKNNKINKEVKKSEREVKRLETAYKNLEVAIDEAYGTMVVGAKQAAIANKELQLAELRRQLQLEQSRKKKHRDEDKIQDLRSQIIDLQNDIRKSYQEIATELLGFSDVGDAAEDMIGTFIDNLRSGEDAMASFTTSVKDMIANLVKKMIVTKVIGPQLEALVDDMNERIRARSKYEAEAYEKAVEQQTQATSLSENEIIQKIIEQRQKELMKQGVSKLAAKTMAIQQGITQEDIDSYLDVYQQEVKRTKKELDKKTTPTLEDIDLVAKSAYDLVPTLEGWEGRINEILKRYDLFKDTSDKQLSALQQGIQGVTEDTASAVEAYLNGMSQQAYLRNDLLTQIRDAVVTMDVDVQTGVQAQMLLQLQQSYAVQMAIQGILEGWNNPSGQAVRVELVS